MSSRQMVIKCTSETLSSKLSKLMNRYGDVTLKYIIKKESTLPATDRVKCNGTNTTNISYHKLNK